MRDTNRSPQLDVARLRVFANALDSAVRDVEIEQLRPVHYFYDVDAVHKAIIGYTLRPDSLPDTRNPREVFHALLTTAELPPIRFLRPHLIEFNQLVEKEYRYDRKPFKQAWHRAQQEYLVRHLGIDKLEAELRKISEAVDTAIANRAFLDFIRQYGVEVFVKLQLSLAGSPSNRVRRMWLDHRFKLLEDSSVPSFPGDNPKTRSLLKELNRARPWGEAAMSNIIDASALALLSEESGRAEVRFYTETKPVREIFAHPEFVGYFSHGGEDGRGILRDEHYFLIRASFAALSFSKKTREETVRNYESEYYSFDELERYSRDLNQALSTVDGLSSIDSLLENVRLRERPADVVFQRVYELEFLRNVVLEWRIDRGMQQWIPDLFRIYRNRSYLESADAHLNREVELLSGELSTQIGGLKNWRHYYDQFHSAAMARSQQVTFRDPLPDFAADLGFGRWGIEHDFEDTSTVIDTIRRLVRSSDEVRELECSELAAQASTIAQNHVDLKYLLCVVWFLQLPEILCSIYENGLTRNSIECIPGYGALYYVSRVKSIYKKERRASELTRGFDKVVQEAEQYVSRFSSQERGYALMGLAHVTYWVEVYLREHRVAKEKQNSRFDQSAISMSREGLALKSILSAERAMQLFEENSQAWLFAVNHAAYVGMSHDLQKDATARYYAILQDTPRVRTHYRFADTLAYLYIRAAQRRIDEHGLEALISDPSLREVRNGTCHNLHRASEYYQRSGSCFGDEEVIAHRGKVDSNLTFLDCTV